MDASLFTDLKSIIPPIITLGVGITGFFINTRARLKRFANERISTLKDIQALPEEVVNDWYIQEEIKRQMRNSVLKDLTGISNVESAEKYLKVLANSELNRTELHHIRKALPSMYLRTIENKHKTFKLDEDSIWDRARNQLLIFVAAILLTFFFEYFAIYNYAFNKAALTILFTALASASTGITCHAVFNLPNVLEVKKIAKIINYIASFDDHNKKTNIKTKSF